MPSVKKRIQVRVSTEVDQALLDFKEVSGVAPSSFIAQLVSDSLPMIKTLTASLKAAKVEPNNGVAILREMLSEARDGIEVAEEYFTPELESSLSPDDLLRKAPKHD